MSLLYDSYAIRRVAVEVNLWPEIERLMTKDHMATRMTEEIRSEPGEAEKLDQARQHAREGKLISQEELDREFEADDE